MPVEIQQLTPAAVVRRAVELQAVYEAMYGIRPGGAADIPAVLGEHGRRPGFRLCVATAGGGVVGLAYGFTGRPGQAWRDEMAAALPPEHAREWLDGHFEFAEFGVIPSRRREGIGTGLYDAVFDGLPHDRAVLTVREGNEPALAFYRRRGWEPLAAGFVAAAGHGPYVIMGARLPQQD